MAVDKLVDSTQLNSDLTSVANAIRTKGGTSSQLAFPSGFISAVQAIPTGITPTGTKQISIAQNGTATEDVTNYANAQITANVPNSYSAGDEGKVVSNGALVAQTSDTVTQNDTYDTTLINSLTVAVSGGGGSGVKVDTITYTVAAQTLNPKIPTVASNSAKILFVAFNILGVTFPTTPQCYSGALLGPASMEYGNPVDNQWNNYRTSSNGSTGWSTSGSGTGGPWRDAGYVYLGVPSSMPFKVGDVVEVKVYYTD